MHNLTIKLRLALSFGLLALLILVISMTSVIKMQTMQEALREITAENDLAIDYAHELRNALDGRAIAVRDIVLAKDSNSRAQALEDLKNHRKAFMEYHDKFFALLTMTHGTQEEHQQLANVKDLNDPIKEKVDLIVRATQENNQAEIINLFSVTNKLVEEQRSNLESLIQIEEKINQEAISRAKDALETAIIIMLSLLAICTLIAGVSAYTTTNSITQPISHLLHTLTYVAKGDLTVNLVPSGQNEITELEVGVKNMIKDLRQNVTQMRENAVSVKQTSHTLSAAAEQVRAASDTQSQSSESMAAALEEMYVSIGQVSSLSDNARALAEESSQNASLGSNHINSMVQEINNIANIISETVTHSQELGQESERISSIISVIKGVAEQTNLLALNAAIEAARAGEMGRGFAVVADEVRQLAERSANSAQEITLMVKSIQERIRAMLVRMEATVNRINEGKSLALISENAMHSIENGAKQVTDVVDNVSLALKEQTIAGKEIASRVEHINMVAGENTAAVSSVANTAKELSQLATQLMDSVAGFRINA